MQHSNSHQQKVQTVRLQAFFQNLWARDWEFGTIARVVSTFSYSGKMLKAINSSNIGLNMQNLEFYEYEPT